MNISFPPSFAAADVCKVKSDEIPSIRIYQYSIARVLPQDIEPPKKAPACACGGF